MSEYVANGGRWNAAHRRTSRSSHLSESSTGLRNLTGKLNPFDPFQGSLRIRIRRLIGLRQINSLVDCRYVASMSRLAAALSGYSRNFRENPGIFILGYNHLK